MTNQFVEIHTKARLIREFVINYSSPAQIKLIESWHKDPKLRPEKDKSYSEADWMNFAGLGTIMFNIPGVERVTLYQYELRLFVARLYSLKDIAEEAKKQLVAWLECSNEVNDLKVVLHHDTPKTTTKTTK